VQPACWRIQAEKLAPFLMEIDSAVTAPGGARPVLARKRYSHRAGRRAAGSATARLP
jgi:hypothetical protein